VEERTPFLDPRLARAASRLPDGMKVRDGLSKWAQRKRLENISADGQPFAPRQGFPTPIGDWIKGQGSRLGPLMAAQPGVAEISDPAKMRLLFSHISRRRYSVTCWKLLFHALWHRRQILALRPAGDAFESLATV
jgi:asparagine synthase (glutamine-hydrolysing)